MRSEEFSAVAFVPTPLLWMAVIGDAQMNFVNILVCQSVGIWLSAMEFDGWGPSGLVAQEAQEVSPSCQRTLRSQGPRHRSTILQRMNAVQKKASPF